MADYAAIAREDELRTRRSLVTPEGVDLNLRLAQLGQRLSAFLLDLLIMVAVLFAGTLLILLGVFSVGVGSAQVAAMIWLLGFFILRNCYFILLEMGPRAATFGKRITGLRVVARDGGRLTADAVIARNLLRELEFYLPLSFLAYGAAQGTVGALSALVGLGWTCLFLFFPFFNRDRLRVGDLLAGTWVIQAPRTSLGLDLLSDPARQAPVRFTDAQLDAYGAFELQTLEKVLRAGDANAMAAVADTISRKIGVERQGDDVHFLHAYYYALRARLERQLLFGRRRHDKHDVR